MSAMRATGMKAFTGFGPLRRAGRGRLWRGVPRLPMEPMAKVKPPPGSPIWPSMAASTTVIQKGCSPWSPRCSD